MRRNALLLRLYEQPKPYVRGQKLKGIDQLPGFSKQNRTGNLARSTRLPADLHSGVRNVTNARNPKSFAMGKAVTDTPIAGVRADPVSGQIEGRVTRLGVTHADLPGDAAQRVGLPPAYEPEREGEVVAEEAFASGAKLRVVCGDLRHSDAEAVAVSTDADLRAADVEALYFLQHTEMQGRHLYGDSFASVADQASAHYDRFGTIPVGCVGRLEGAGAQKAVFCLHTPPYIDGHYHEARWLASAYVNLLEECRFLELRSLALTCPAEFPLEEAGPVLARSVVDWLELECLHHTHASDVVVYTQTIDEARRVAAFVSEASSSF